MDFVVAAKKTPLTVGVVFRFFLDCIDKLFDKTKYPFLHVVIRKVSVMVRMKVLYLKNSLALTTHLEGVHLGRLK